MKRILFLFLLVLASVIGCISGFSQTAKLKVDTIQYNRNKLIFINSPINLGSSGLSFNDTLYFSSQQRTYVDFTVSASFTVVVKSTGKLTSAPTEVVAFIGDGTHTVNFGSCIIAGSNTFINTAGKINSVIFWIDGGGRVFYSINYGN